MALATSYRLFVACALGLEKLLQNELAEVGVGARLVEGGVECRGDQEVLARMCISSRVAESVRVRLKEFHARGFPELERNLRRLPFRAFLPSGTPSRLKVVCHKSKLWHSDAVKQRAEAVLRDHVGLRPAAEGEAQIIHLRVENDLVQVSLDASGDRLHRRGYRTHVEKASLRETLAAALVLSVAPDLPKHEGDLVLWDPFCGAGTVFTEALGWAHGVLPGAERAHAFQSWRTFDEHAFGLLRASAIEEVRAAAPFPHMRAIVSDRADRALDAARHNSKGAGLSEQCTFLVGDVEDVAPSIPMGAFIVTNPPYGKRIQEAGAIQKLLRVLKSRPDLNPVVVLTGGAARDVIPKDRRALFRTKNGGVPVSARLLRGPSGPRLLASRPH